MYRIGARRGGKRDELVYRQWLLPMDEDHVIVGVHPTDAVKRLRGN